MHAMVLERIVSLDATSEPLVYRQVPDPKPGEGEILVRVSACGVCHTELDEIEGRTAPPRLPVIPGHQAVGRVAALGANVREHAAGDRVGVAWIHSACGQCAYCRSGRENLCAAFKATGRDVDGGYAEYLTCQARCAYAIPDQFSDVQAAPLLCAGAIGHRALSLAGLCDGGTLGLSGFGASAHLVIALARYLYPRAAVFVFARGAREREFACELGAAWAGGFDQMPPALCDAIIDTTPAWKPVVASLARLAPGGRLVINAIRKEDADRAALAALDYPAHLWMEKEIKSVANVTRRDVREFLDAAAAMPIVPVVREYALADANRALAELKAGGTPGAKVLRVG